MKEPCILQKRYRDILFRKHHICSGIPVKRKIPVIVFCHTYKSKGGPYFIIKRQADRIYINKLKGFLKLPPEHVISYTPDKCGLSVKF